MTAGSGGSRAVAGGPAPHIPVLGRPVVELLTIRPAASMSTPLSAPAAIAAPCWRPPNARSSPSTAIRPQSHWVADLVQSAAGRLTLVEDRFANLDAVAREAGFATVDGVVLDLGVSSMQLDTPARGFSFRADGPLDMRMSGEGPSAADVVNAADERDLANIIFLLGEERHSRAVARAIVKARSTAPIATTAALADIVASVVRSRPGDIHPATRTFQALRIFVNDELGELGAGACRRRTRAQTRRPAGRGVVPFARGPHRQDVPHRAQRDRRRLAPCAGSQAPAPSFRLLTKRPLIADAEEVARNPRARSAKLRAGRAHRGAGAHRRRRRPAAAPAGARRYPAGALSHAPRSISWSSPR